MSYCDPQFEFIREMQNFGIEIPPSKTAEQFFIECTSKDSLFFFYEREKKRADHWYKKYCELTDRKDHGKLPFGLCYIFMFSRKAILIGKRTNSFPCEPLTKYIAFDIRKNKSFISIVWGKIKLNP